MRVDVIAENYYDSPFYSWLIYLSNKIIDPYYDWHLTDDQLENYLIDVFGTLTDPQLRVSYWENNYYNDTSVITEATYNALPDALKRYWSPVFEPGARV
jgi:hypothetical protein